MGTILVLPGAVRGRDVEAAARLAWPIPTPREGKDLAIDFLLSSGSLALGGGDRARKGARAKGGFLFCWASYRTGEAR